MTTHDTAVQLKPCPFCGGPAEPYSVYIACRNGGCSASPSVYGATQERAAEAWNTRATIPIQKLDTVNADSLEASNKHLRAACEHVIKWLGHTELEGSDSAHPAFKKALEKCRAALTHGDT